MSTQTPGAGSPAPLSRTWTLACGIPARFEMPDMLAFADGSFDIPNETQAGIYELIYGAGADVAPLEQLAFDRRKLKGLYALFALVCVEPRVVLDNEDRKPGELGPRHVGWSDLTAAYNFFQYGPPPAVPAAEDQEPVAGA